MDATLTRQQHHLRHRQNAEMAKASALQSVKAEDEQDPDFKADGVAAGLKAAEEVPHLAAQLSQVLLQMDYGQSIAHFHWLHCHCLVAMAITHHWSSFKCMHLRSDAKIDIC